MRVLNIVLYVTSYEDLRVQVADMLRQRTALPRKVVFDGIPAYKWYANMRENGILIETGYGSVILDVECL